MGRWGYRVFIWRPTVSESERRRNYRYNRVLIDSERILDPQFDDAVVFLSGAQVEMLRNVTQYLRRLETYVDERHLGYYITPDATDYDDILEIVADLEETLMGNPNTIWGYAAQWAEWLGETKSGDGAFFAVTAAVPADYVYVLQSAFVRNATTAKPAASITAYVDAKDYTLARALTLAGTAPLEWNGCITLKEGDYIKMYIAGCLNGDSIRSGVVGYKMVVP